MLDEPAEIFLDCGDLGRLMATVTGTVTESGAIGAGQGYLQTEITEVIVHIPAKPSGFVGVNVTHLIDKATQAYFGEMLERKYQRDVATDFGRGA